MKNISFYSLKLSIVLTSILINFNLPNFANAAETWNIIISKSLSHDKAIKVAIDDLQKAGVEYGLTFKIFDDSKNPAGNSIIIGDETRNRQTAKLIKKHRIEHQCITHEQGYEIITKNVNGNKIVIVAGGSIIGDVYGLYWIWDRIRVHKKIPNINVKRKPALPIRLGLAWGRSGRSGSTEEEMRNSLRYSINWVSGPAILDLVSWNSEPERTINEKNRERARELIEYAHSLHMKYFSFANEFTYHPSILEEFGATLSPCDPSFWDAVQAKFRRLFQALPELDGIEICNDDISGFWENYRGFDVMHEGEGCEWPLDKRFRTFVKKVYNVVVNEFNKTYFHFTWSLVSYEQHNQPDVFKKIFTNDVPVNNLYLIPKITAADRWWHQPYNPTFNQTPHNTIVGFETMNYYESSKAHIFPTFPGQYFQAGLQTFLAPKNNNVKGSGFLAGSLQDGCNTRNVTAYVLYRLSWNPDEKIEDIARDFCAIHFGGAAAEKMAQIYLLSPIAYKYGLHIEPVSYGKFNSFIHMRVGTFPGMGYPSIDGGKEHMDFLYEIYLRCKPWKIETLDDLDHGLSTARKMVEMYKSTKPLIQDNNFAQTVENSLNMTRLLIETNNLYVKTAFAYFEYRENPTLAKKDTLSKYFSQLVTARNNFINAPGFGYKLFGVNQLLKNVELALKDLAQAEQHLEKAPTRKELESTVAHQQQLYKQILQKHSDEAIKFLHFEAEIDGRDILIIRDDKYEIEHLRWDGPAVRECRFIEKLPQKVVTVIPKDIESRPMHPFILQQPGEENDYTVKVYLYDAPGGYGIVKFDLYFISKRPEELGLDFP